VVVRRSPHSASACCPSVGAAAAIATLIAYIVVSAQQTPRYVERVDVARIIIDARVLDDGGSPITGLTADDFKVTIDGKVARIETATWVGGRDVDVETTPLDAAQFSEAAPAGPGRLIVFLFQKDFERSRLVGLMRMLLKSRQVLDTLTADDRVAILSFDSHLKIWTDFTNSRQRLDRVLAHDLLLELPPPVLVSFPLSLVEHLGADSGRRAYGIERALQLIGEALQPLPGSKSVVLIGHGFGRFSGSGVTMESDYHAARQALVESRTSVFSLDVTDADYHSLEAGLQIVSEQTGGFYERTHVFPDLAMRRLAGALAGYYVLFVERPESRRTLHDVRTELTRRKGRVFAATSFSGAER
jgi:VWFA-related protein